MTIEQNFFAAKVGRSSDFGTTKSSPTPTGSSRQFFEHCATVNPHPVAADAATTLSRNAGEGIV
jgi:hypothetical protein